MELVAVRLKAVKYWNKYLSNNIPLTLLERLGWDFSGFPLDTQFEVQEQEGSKVLGSNSYLYNISLFNIHPSKEGNEKIRLS